MGSYGKIKHFHAQWALLNRELVSINMASEETLKKPSQAKTQGVVTIFLCYIVKDTEAITIM